MKYLISIILTVSTLTVFGQKADLLDKAVENYQGGKYGKAITQLQEFLEVNTSVGVEAKAFYYLGASYLAMAVQSNGSSYGYRDVYMAWKRSLERDLSGKWMSKMQADVKEYAANANSRKQFIQDAAMVTNLVKMEITEEDLTIGYINARAEGYNMENSFAKALSDYKLVVEMYKRKPEEKYNDAATNAYYRLADDYYYRQSNKPLALEYAQEGLAISPDEKRLEVLEAKLLASMPGKEEEAEVKLDQLLEKYPEDEKLMFFQARNLKNKKPEKAAELFEKALKDDPENLDILFFLGQYHLNRSDELNREGQTDIAEIQDMMERGLSFFEKYHELKPENREVIKILIQFYEYMYKEEEAEKMRQKL